MGNCLGNKKKLSKEVFSGELYSNFDKIVFLQKFFMENNLTKEEISPFFTSIIYNQIIEEKTSKKKYSRFFKWCEMSFKPYHKLLSSLQKDIILSSLNLENEKIIKKHNENEENSTYLEIPNFSQDISISEQGLRNYYFSNQIHFESRTIKSPPATFRWISWIILSGVPISRPAFYYTNLLTYDLPNKVEDQIQKDICRTIPKEDDNYNEKISSLYRLLRAIANLDKDLGYSQGMNFLVYYLLDISNRNEIDVFYILMSIFSCTFSKKFGMRGFFIDDFPLLNLFSDIFDKKLNTFFPDVYKHNNKINMPPLCWAAFWMQQIYTLFFPKEILLRVWDYFFVYGINFLISLNLSIVDYFQDRMLKFKDIIEFQNFFKLLNPKFNEKDPLDEDIPEYDIEIILKNAVEKYFIKFEEIEREIKKNYPNYNNEFAYDYKSIESNPDVKSEYAIYALNNSKVSSRNFSTSFDYFDSTLMNSSKIKGNNNQKIDSKFNINKNEKINKNIPIIAQNEEQDSFDLDFEDEENEDDEDFQIHIKDIISKKNDVKFIYRK